MDLLVVGDGVAEDFASGPLAVFEEEFVGCGGLGFAALFASTGPPHE